MSRVLRDTDALKEVLKWEWDAHVGEGFPNHPFGETWLAGVVVGESDD